MIYDVFIELGFGMSADFFLGGMGYGCLLFGKDLLLEFLVSLYAAMALFCDRCVRYVDC